MGNLIVPMKVRAHDRTFIREQLKKIIVSHFPEFKDERLSDGRIISLLLKAYRGEIKL